MWTSTAPPPQATAALEIPNHAKRFVFLKLRLGRQGSRQLRSCHSPCLAPSSSASIPGIRFHQFVSLRIRDVHDSVMSEHPGFREMLFLSTSIFKDEQ